MTRLAVDDLLSVALKIQYTTKSILCFHIAAEKTVQRENLRFLHNYNYYKDEAVYSFPLYTFNNMIFIQTDPLSPLGEGPKIGHKSSSGNYYFIPTQK